MNKFQTIFSQKLIFILAIVTSIAAFYITLSHNYILTYNDAASHLNIARRVVDNIQPGLAQIGTVWLPLPHLAMLLFAWNDYLWNTGFAGSIVSMISYVVAVVFVYKTVFLVTGSRVGALLGSLVMMLNPNLLYLQSTPMTEPMLLAMFALSIYFLAKYITQNIIHDLLFCSIAVMGATLIRYDGWFLFMSLLVLLPLWVLVLKGRGRAEASFLLFATMGGFGIFGWVLWNLMIFGDPLYFIYGPYSAYAQQRVLESVGQLPTEGNVFNALYYFLWAMISNNGIIIFLAGVIGAVIVPFLMRKKSQLIVLLAAFSPILFNVVALYLGQSAMNVPQAPDNPGLFNIRYGLMALPFLSLSLGIVSSKKLLALIVFCVIVAQSFLFYREGHPVALADGLHGLHNTYYTVEASKWLRENYEGGLILTSLASHDAFVARAQIPMKNYIHEGASQYWDKALNGPGENIQYVAMLSFPPDIVYKSIAERTSFQENYKLIHEYEEFHIYKRK